MPNTEKDGGYILITVALLLVILLAFAALAVDVGVMYGVKTSAQRVADAAALAGAFTFIVDPASPQPATARNHALQTALNNRVLGDPIEESDVLVDVNLAERTVTVDIDLDQDTFFARAFGATSSDIRARGFAEAAPNATGAYCVKPWFVPNTVMSTEAPCAACAVSETLISGGEITAFARSRIGTQFRLKPQNPSGSIAPGQFYAIQLPGSVGGNDYRNDIGRCPAGAVACNESYSVQTGNMVGPTVQGVRDLIGNPPRDSYIAPGQYRRLDGTISDTSRALIVAPIWDTCGVAGFCPAGNFPSGTNVELRIIGFALVFLEGIQGNDVVARLINVFACGAGAEETEQTGPYSIPLRLVRPTN